MTPEEIKEAKTNLLRNHIQKMHDIDDRACAAVSLLGAENIRNIVTLANAKAPAENQLSKERIDEMVKAIHNA